MTASRRFGVAALLAAGGFVLGYAALILTETGQRLENLALRGAHQQFEELRAESIAELHQISMLGFAAAIGLVMLVALLRRKPRVAIIAAPTM